jgi:cardiolipin synthase
MSPWSHLPNGITVLRLLLVVPVVACLAGGSPRTALAVFGLAALTDALDGYLARRLGAVTRLGARLDPLADKCLLSGAYLALGLAGAAPWWLVGLILGRDLYILLGAGLLYAVTRRRDFPPSVWGKLSTLVQIVAAVTLMGRQAFPTLVPAALAAAVVWPAAAATLWSGAHYTWRAARPIDGGPAAE